MPYTPYLPDEVDGRQIRAENLVVSSERRAFPCTLCSKGKASFYTREVSATAPGVFRRTFLCSRFSDCEKRFSVDEILAMAKENEKVKLEGTDNFMGEPSSRWIMSTQAALTSETKDANVHIKPEPEDPGAQTRIQSRDAKVYIKTEPTEDTEFPTKTQPEYPSAHSASEVETTKTWQPGPIAPEILEHEVNNLQVTNFKQKQYIPYPRKREENNKQATHIQELPAKIHKLEKARLTDAEERLALLGELKEVVDRFGEMRRTIKKLRKQNEWFKQERKSLLRRLLAGQGAAQK